jgi:fructuronate reductase
MDRLSEKTLCHSTVPFEAYDRAGAAGIVHLGVGAFHRAHQAVYLDRYLGRGHKGWCITGASMRSRTVGDQLDPQDGLYTVVEREGDHSSARVVRSIGRIIVATETPQDLVSAIADEAVKIITLTVTEKGYCLTPSGDGLNLSDPAVLSDMKAETTPRTAPGFIAAGLEKRYADGAPPVSILSCDNMAENGQRTRKAVVEMLEARKSPCADWVRNTCSFPSSMVDRIVPSTTHDDIEALSAETGYRDLGMVKTEPFSQWVIEDDFCSGRPALEEVGVQFTSDVHAWEKAKLRLLNGAHSALAYLGCLAGHEFVHTAIAASGYKGFIDALWDEAGVTLGSSAEIDIPAYRSALLKRFHNLALQHKTFQIASDGSQKLPQRFLNTIRERRDLGLQSPALTLAVAGWICWQRGIDDDGRGFEVHDPLADQLRSIADSARMDARQLALAFCEFEPVFGQDFAKDEAFTEALTYALSRIMTVGAGLTVEHFSARTNRNHQLGV